MIDRDCSRTAPRRLFLAALLLAMGVGAATAGEFSPLPETNEHGAHIGYTLARHYSLLIPGRESRFFAGAVLSYAPDMEATLHDPGAGVVLIQNLAGDRITGSFQLDLGARLYAAYRVPAGRAESAGPAPAGFFLEERPYPRTSGELDLRFTAADRYHFPTRAFLARVGGAVALGFADEPYSTVHLTGSLRAVIPVIIPAVQAEVSAGYRGHVDPGWLDGPAPASALSYLHLRGYTGAERLAHGATVTAAIAARLPFEFYVPMSAGAGVYVDAGRVSGTLAGLVPSLAPAPDVDGRAVAGGFVEYRILPPFRIGSVTLSAGMGMLVPDWTPAAPWLRIDYRTGWFFSDPL